MNKDLEQLRLLSIFHYVLAGVTALFSLFPLIHVVVGLAVVFGGPSMGNEVPPPVFGWLFVLIGGFFILAGISLAVLIFFAGRMLSRRRHYLFCFVAAALECLFMPLGTVLGIFTIVVLSRESVKALFVEGQEG